MALCTMGGRGPATPRASRAGWCVPLLRSGHARSDGMRTGGTEVVTRHGARRRAATSLAQRRAGPGAGGTAGVSPPPVPHRPWQGYEATRRRGEACRLAPGALLWRTFNHTLARGHLMLRQRSSPRRRGRGATTRVHPLGALHAPSPRHPHLWCQAHRPWLSLPLGQACEPPILSVRPSPPSLGA